MGFAVLAYWLGREIGGYVNVHLECRYLHRGGEGNHRKLRPEWSDIFLWAVLVGKPEIAGLLWTKTQDPLRMAVYASLFCHHIAAGIPKPVDTAAALASGRTTRPGRSPPPRQWPQPVRSHPPALQRPPRD